MAVSHATLAQFVGVYELGPGFDLTVTVEAGSLMGQATRQPKFQLLPNPKQEIELQRPARAPL